MDTTEGCATELRGLDSHTLARRRPQGWVATTIEPGQKRQLCHLPLRRRREFTQKAISGGNTTTLSYDVANEVKSLTVMNSATLRVESDLRLRRKGNRTRSIDHNNAYDQANRLTAFQSAPVSSSYAYIGDGLLTLSRSQGASTNDVWNPASSLPLIVEEGTRSVINGPNGLPLEQVTSGGTRYYYHQDLIGSTLAISDSTGSMVQSYGYDPYGNLTSSIGSIANPFQFQGQFLDSASGLYYLRARFYDPVSIQFLTQDQMTRLSRARYGYAHDSPVSQGDPSGLWPDWQAGWSALTAGVENAASQDWTGISNYFGAVNPFYSVDSTVNFTFGTILLIGGVVGITVAAVETITALAGAPETGGVSLLELATVGGAATAGAAGFMGASACYSRVWPKRGRSR